MFSLIVWAVAAGLTRLAGLLFATGEGAEVFADRLLRPVDDATARRLVNHVPPEARTCALRRVRRGLWWGLIPPRPPLEEFTGHELARSTDAVLLDLYTPEAAASLRLWLVLRPQRRSPEVLRKLRRQRVVVRWK